MEALLIHLTRKLEGQPHTYLCTKSPLSPYLSWIIPAEPYDPANRNRNAAISQQLIPSLAEDIRPRSSSSISSTASGNYCSSCNHRSSSSCTFLPSPYCSYFKQTIIADRPFSYLSDDDLLAPFTHNESTVDTTPSRELSTEEQIEMVRQCAVRVLELG